MTQLERLEAAKGSLTVLCPQLAYLALNAEYQMPLIERHFSNLAEECATETRGTGGMYKIQLIQGARAVEAAVKIREILAPKEEEQSCVEEAEELAA
jgi:hypothetical protein